MSKGVIAVLLTAALGITGILVASAEADAKKEDRVCVDLGLGYGLGLRPVPVHPKRVQSFAGGLALAAVHAGAWKDMDSEQLSDYVIDVAKRVAYGDYQDDPIEPTDPTDTFR